MRAFRSEQHKPARSERRPERRKIGMAGKVYMIDVIHRRPANPAVIPCEPQRLDQIDICPKTSRKAQNSTNISGDFRFKQSNTHRR